MSLHSIKLNFFLVVSILFSGEVFSSSINDPTKPIYSNSSGEKKSLKPEAKSHKELSLQSIFFSSDKKIVVVNGEILKEGNAVEGVVIEDIHEDYVTVKYKKTTAKLMLSKKLYLDELTGEISD